MSNSRRLAFAIVVCLTPTCLLPMACQRVDIRADVAPLPSTRPTASTSAVPIREWTRVDFAKALASIRPTMTADDVLSRLGTPSDIRTAADPGGITATRTTEVWRYGTDGHLSCATLGTVHIQADRTVQYVFGGHGTPFLDPKITEDQLRGLMRVIHQVPSYNHEANPLRIIQAVNVLQPLGKAAAVAVLAEYLRVSSPFEDEAREGTFLLMRTLFDPPAVPGYFPNMAVGASSPAPPKDPKELPRFPVAIVDDIPFSVVHGYSLAGKAEAPESHLDWMNKHAALRTKPLLPTATPIATVGKLVGTATTPFVTGLKLFAADRTYILEQGARTVTALVPTTPALESLVDWRVNPDDGWLKLEKATSGLNVVWSPAGNTYVMAPSVGKAAAK